MHQRNLVPIRFGCWLCCGTTLTTQDQRQSQDHFDRLTNVTSASPKSSRLACQNEISTKNSTICPVQSVSTAQTFRLMESRIACPLSSSCGNCCRRLNNAGRNKRFNEPSLKRSGLVQNESKRPSCRKCREVLVSLLTGPIWIRSTRRLTE